MRKWLILCSFLLLSLFTQAQCVGFCTTVTATLIDSSGQVWANANVQANFVASFGATTPLNSGQPIASPNNTILTNGSGVFTLSLDDNSKVTPTGSRWIFIMCPNATVTNCSQLTTTVTGASLNLSATLSAALIVPKVNAAPSIYRAYSDTQAQGGLGAIYWNTGSNTLRGCILSLCNGTGWTSVGGTGSGLPAGTVGQVVTYTSLNVGIATSSYIDNTQSGGNGTTDAGPKTLSNSSFQFFGSACPSSPLTLGGNLVGFGSGNDCNPYWGTSGGVFQLQQYSGNATSTNVLTAFDAGGRTTPANGIFYSGTPGQLNLGSNAVIQGQLCLFSSGAAGSGCIALNNFSYTGNYTFSLPDTGGGQIAVNTGSTTAGHCVDYASDGTRIQDSGAPCGGSGGGTSVSLENCTPDGFGFVGYSVASLTNYQYGHWEYVAGQGSAIYCTVYIPVSQTGATIVLDIASNDSTAGHTANFQTCDGLVTSGSINIGALTCAANQAFTTTSTAYNRVSLTFNVQSTLSNGAVLVVKILTNIIGTAPTSNMLVYPHFVL